MAPSEQGFQMNRYPDYLSSPDGDGTISFVRASSPHDTLIVSSFWVRPERRGLGIGVDLMKRAQSLGARLVLTIEPDVDTQHPKSHEWLARFYVRSGFRRLPSGVYEWRPENFPADADSF